MSHPRQELQALVHDLRIFLQNSIPQRSELPSSDAKKFPPQVLGFSKETKGEKLLSNTTNASQPGEQTISPNLSSLGPSEAMNLEIQSKLKETKTGEKSQAEAKVDLSTHSTQWELHAMASPSMPSPTPLASYSKIITPPLDVLLVLPQEKSQHRLFLENVARAITRIFASAVVVLFHENLFQSKQYLFIFAPIELLQKRFPKAQPHIPFREETTTWVPLESLDFYERDIHCKRALWMTIQRALSRNPGLAL